MASDWRNNLELWGLGGYVIGLPGRQGYFRYAAQLITPVFLPGWGTATHIAAGPRSVVNWQWHLGKLTPVGGLPQWTEGGASSVSAATRWPLALFPVLPD